MNRHGVGRRRRLRAFALALLVAVTTACAPPIAAELAGRPRTRLIEGPAAARIVARLHASDVAPADSAVAEYGGGELILFVSRYPDTEAAAGALEAMLAGLRSGRTPFVVPIPCPGRQGVWRTRGPGGDHAIWANGPVLFWLQGPGPAVEDGLRELTPRR